MAVNVDGVVVGAYCQRHLRQPLFSLGVIGHRTPPVRIRHQYSHPVLISTSPRLTGGKNLPQWMTFIALFCRRPTPYPRLISWPGVEFREFNAKASFSTSGADWGRNSAALVYLTASESPRLVAGSVNLTTESIAAEVKTIFPSVSWLIQLLGGMYARWRVVWQCWHHTLVW